MQTKRKNETTMNEREREDERIPFALVAYLPRYNITDLSLHLDAKFNHHCHHCQREMQDGMGWDGSMQSDG
jgi:hypothetical protein